MSAKIVKGLVVEITTLELAHVVKGKRNRGRATLKLSAVAPPLDKVSFKYQAKFKWMNVEYFDVT